MLPFYFILIKTHKNNTKRLSYGKGILMESNVKDSCPDAD
jgi:hypothetical protein